MAYSMESDFSKQLNSPSVYKTNVGNTQPKICNRTKATIFRAYISKLMTVK